MSAITILPGSVRSREQERVGFAPVRYWCGEGDCVPVPVVLGRLVVLRRVLGFCAIGQYTVDSCRARSSTYWPLRRLWVSNCPGDVRGGWQSRIDFARTQGGCGSLTDVEVALALAAYRITPFAQDVQHSKLKDNDQLNAIVGISTTWSSAAGKNNEMGHSIYHCATAFRIRSESQVTKYRRCLTSSKQDSWQPAVTYRSS